MPKTDTKQARSHHEVVVFAKAKTAQHGEGILATFLGPGETLALAGRRLKDSLLF